MGHGLMDTIWTKLREAWDHRNELLHQPTDSANFTKERATLIQRTKKIYEQAANVSRTDQSIFNIPIEDRLKLPDPMLLQWVQNTEPAIITATRQFAAGIRTGHGPPIQEYFLPINSINNNSRQPCSGQKHHEPDSHT